MSVLKLKNGQFKDFDCLFVAYEHKFGKDNTLQSIFDASVTAGLYNMSAKEQRRLMYERQNWLNIIEVL